MTITNGSWQKIALALMTILAGIAVGWTTKVSGQLDEHTQQDKHAKAAWARDVRDNQEAIRSIYREIAINRGILNRIDRNTGGSGDAPDPVPPIQN